MCIFQCPIGSVSSEYPNKTVQGLYNDSMMPSKKLPLALSAVGPSGYCQNGQVYETRAGGAGPALTQSGHHEEHG